MPIVFENITGELAPERPAAPAQEGSSGGSSGGDVLEQVHCELALRAERSDRNYVD